MAEQNKYGMPNKRAGKGRMVSCLLIACAIGNVIGGSICTASDLRDAEGVGAFLFFLAVVLFIIGMFVMGFAE
jgi:predicted MFS family arabinose efflux permease